MRHEDEQYHFRLDHAVKRVHWNLETTAKCDIEEENASYIKQVQERYLHQVELKCFVKKPSHLVQNCELFRRL